MHELRMTEKFCNISGIYGYALTVACEKFGYLMVPNAKYVSIPGIRDCNYLEIEIISHNKIYYHIPCKVSIKIPFFCTEKVPCMEQDTLKFSFVER